MERKTVKCCFDGIDIKLKLCRDCGGQPHINSMSHGERWIDCDCGTSSGLFKNDNQPAKAFLEACSEWNRK